jgi:hypothetical protein
MMTDEELKAEQTNEAQVTIAPTTGEPQEKKAPPPFTRTHGFYSKVLTSEQQADYDQAVKVDGMDSEIALLRVKILSIIAHDPDNIKLLSYATNALARLIMTKYNISKTDKKGILEGVENVFRDVAVPWGIRGIINQFFRK